MGCSRQEYWGGVWNALLQGNLLKAQGGTPSLMSPALTGGVITSATQEGPIWSYGAKGEIAPE